MVPRQPETDAEFYLHLTVDALSTGAISFIVLHFIQKETLGNSVKGALISAGMRGTASALASFIKTHVLDKQNKDTSV